MSEERAIAIMRGVAGCNHCFETVHGLERVPDGVPKPRWIGSRYYAARQGVVLVLLNPGEGRTLSEDWKRREQKVFEAFRNGGDYEDIRNYFRLRRDEELRGTTATRPVFSWYEKTFRLAFEEVAQINMAWCASKGNKYRPMLDPCFERHTGVLLQALEPHVVLLSGSNVHCFQARIESLLPGVHVRPTIHYAHREGRQRELDEGCKSRAWFDTLSGMGL